MKKVDYEHFSRFKMPHSLKARGKDLYFCVKNADMTENSYKNDLCVLKDGKVKRLTALGDMGSFTLTEEGILFAAARTKAEKEAQEKGLPRTVFYLLPYDGGEAVPAFTLNVRAGKIYPDGKGRYFVQVTENTLWDTFLEQEKGDEEKAAARMKEEADYQVVDEIPFYFNGPGFVNGNYDRVYLYENGELKAVTAKGRDIRITDAQGEKLILAESLKTAGRSSLFNRLLLMDKETFEEEDISLSDNASHEAAWLLPDGGIAALINTADRFGLNQNVSVFLRTAGEWKAVYTAGECSFYNSVGSDVKAGGEEFGSDCPVKDGRLYFTDTVRSHSAISVLDLASGTVGRLTDREMNITGLDFYEDGFAFIALEDNGGSELYAMDAKGNIRQLTQFNTGLCAEYEYSRPEPFTFTDDRGVEIDGWVMKPAEFDENKTYPAILDVHGGPKTVYGSCYFHEMQLWASEGYFVFFCNPVGGDGRGDTFADIRGIYGGPDYDDIMQFTDEVLKRYPQIDPARVGVTGGSYGGFMTNWIIGHTDRFAAAASQRSIANWLAFYETSDIGYFFAGDQAGGTPWTRTEKLWDQSPLKYADKVKTPTLFIHSDQDYRCPLSEGIQMFTAIKDHGVEARMCIFKGENHELSRSGKPKHRVRRLKEITEWFGRFLKETE